jgi:hypothetical protein
MNDHLAVGPARAVKPVLFNEAAMVVNFAVANEVAAHERKRLVASGSQPVNSQTMEPDAALAIHHEAVPNEATVVRTPVRDFSKIGLQLVQQGHGNALSGSNGFVIKNTAHDIDTNNQSNSLNDCSKNINIL